MHAFFAAMSRSITTALAMLLIVMVLLLCLNVLLRYVWGASMLWVDETLVFAMVGMTFLGVVGVSQRNEHLRMSLLLQVLPPRAKWVIEVFEQLATAGVCLFVGWYSYQAISRLRLRGTLSNMAEVPLWLVQATVLIGLIGMALVALARLTGLILQKREG